MGEQLEQIKQETGFYKMQKIIEKYDEGFRTPDVKVSICSLLFVWDGCAFRSPQRTFADCCLSTIMLE